MIEIFQTSTFAWAAAVFLFSLLIGSFLNVVILRLPRRMEHEWRQQCAEFEASNTETAADQAQAKLELEPPPDLVLSRSRCPECGHQITALENLPLVSFLILRGRCSACGTAISWQYPVVELATAVLSALVAVRFGFTVATGAALVLTWCLVTLSVIDLHEQLLPDSITLPLLWLGLLLNTQSVFADPVSAIIGAAGGYVLLWLVYQTFKLATGKEGMGYGDFKLLAVFGAWLGWQSLPLVILLSSFVGAVVGISMVVFHGRDRNIPVPFGPYLAAAGWIALIWGDQIISAYLGIS
jgi:leader peptidase (prepilin peptidase)/N-methyltransferase